MFCCFKKSNVSPTLAFYFELLEKKELMMLQYPFFVVFHHSMTRTSQYLRVQRDNHLWLCSIEKKSLAAGAPIILIWMHQNPAAALL